MNRIIVLGAGMVGRAIALDLSKKNLVTAVDIDDKALSMLTKRQNITTQHLDISNPKALAVAIADFDLVISAVPGFIGYQTIVTTLKNKKNLIDISFLPEDVLPLDHLARQNGVIAITDCGVAPGMPNLILGYHNELMKIENFEYYVGGLPKMRSFPFEYKAPFSPCDVIEEYIRPARFVENGNIITSPAMSDPEIVEFKQIGSLEAFNTDGLRSLIYTMSHIPNMKEKTLRYPGHIRMIQALKAAGFFEKEPIEIKNASVSPFEYTSTILFKAWKLDPDEEEFTIMRIIIEGTEKTKQRKIVYELFDEFDNIRMMSSMARTTGFTATAAAQMIIDGVFTQQGLFTPELLGKYPSCFDYIINYQRERGVIYHKTEE